MRPFQVVCECKEINNYMKKLFLFLQCVSIYAEVCQLKKMRKWELWVNLYWGQNEDYSLRSSISDSSEKPLQRGGGGDVNIYVILAKGEVQATKHTFLQTVAASQEEQVSPWRILLLF